MKLSPIVATACLTLLSACALAVGGVDQNVAVKTVSGTQDIAGARCSLTNDKGSWFVTSPGSVRVHRSSDTLNVKCEAEGFTANAGSAPSGTKGIAFGNILSFGLLGGAIDIGTGAAYDYPSPIIVNLQPVRKTVLGKLSGG